MPQYPQSIQSPPSLTPTRIKAQSQEDPAQLSEVRHLQQRLAIMEAENAALRAQLPQKEWLEALEALDSQIRQVPGHERFLSSALSPSQTSWSLDVLRAASQCLALLRNNPGEK